jgi:hypothetical protein
MLTQTSSTAFYRDSLVFSNDNTNSRASFFVQEFIGEIVYFSVAPPNATENALHQMMMLLIFPTSAALKATT